MTLNRDRSRISAQLQAAWDAGRLDRPDARRLNTVNLVHALAHLTGAGRRNGQANVRELYERIGPAEQLVFVLVDGMGLNVMQALPRDSFLRSHVAVELQAVFPSTTACAITAVATGLWPGEHGVPGWWAYLSERRMAVVTLPFVERVSEQSLDRFGVARELLWPFEPILGRVERDAACIHPEAFWDSTFNRFARGRSRGYGYASIPAAVDHVIRRVRSATAPTYTYLYLPELDTACHVVGHDHPQAINVLRYIDAELERLADAIASRARLVITADHGHINVTPRDHLAIIDGDPMLQLLLSPPGGEPRTPLFHVKPGQRDAFVELFNQRYGTQFALLDIDQVNALRLLGPKALTPRTRDRFGHFMAIALDPVTLMYYRPDQPTTDNHVGHHAGMTPQEMRVPLILA